MVTDLESFIACMEYQPCERRPNHELGFWPQTMQRWQNEAPEAVKDFNWSWWFGDPALGMDRRIFIPVNYGFIPPFERVVIEETDEYEVVRNEKGITTKALKDGSVGGGRMCMDQYIDFPVRCPEDFPEVKKRLIAAIPQRYPANLDLSIEQWKGRQCPLILGHNCGANGFYWRAREFMGTEPLSFALYDQPKLVHEMMEFYCDFIIETSRPVLEKIQIDYFVLNEDFAMKSGPLIGPQQFKEFVFPHLKRMVAFFREHGTRYFAVDSDGDPTVLIPLLMDADVDTFWPIERASNISPIQLRKQFGKSLRLWGGVDKRELTKGPQAIKEHLAELIPLIEEGGFIPTVDHTVPPDVSWDNFRYYWDYKHALLTGDFKKLR